MPVRFDAQYWMLGAGALGRPRGMVWEGRREEGSGWGTHVYLWQIHLDIWQNQYNIVKLNKIFLKNQKIKIKKIKSLESCDSLGAISKHSTWIRASNKPFISKRNQRSSENG